MFDEPVLHGSEGQPTYSGISINHFIDSRGDLSVDRLGATNVDQRIVRFIQEKAEAQSRSFKKKKRFEGWIVKQAKEITLTRKNLSLSIVASPDFKGDVLDNPYHAHIPTPTGLDEHLLALHLRYLFTECGKVQVIPAVSPPRSAATRDLTDWLKKTEWNKWWLHHLRMIWVRIRSPR